MVNMCSDCADSGCPHPRDCAEGCEIASGDTAVQGTLQGAFPIVPIAITIVALGLISAGVAAFFSLRRRREQTAVALPPAVVSNVQQAAESPRPPRSSDETDDLQSDGLLELRGIEHASPQVRAGTLPPLNQEGREEALSRVLHELRVELSLLDVDGLCQRADLEGVADNLIEQARTRGDVSPTDALVELIVAQRRASLRSRKLNRSISLFQGP